MFYVGQLDETWSYQGYSGFQGYTVILNIGRNVTGGSWGSAAATGSGKLYQVKYYGRGVSSIIRLKIFRDDGTNYNYIIGDTVDRNVVAGLQTLIISPEWNIQVGDFLALYEGATSPSTIVTTVTTANATYYKVGNITSNSLKSSWASWTYSFPTFRGHISQESGGLVVGSKWPLPCFSL